MSDWVIRLIEQSGYLGVGFLMFLETVFPPIPSEVIMPVAGVAAAQGKMSFCPSVVVRAPPARCSATSSGISPPARSASTGCKPLIHRYGRWLTMSWPEVERAERWFDAHGIAFVFLGRLLPTVRSLVSIPAGLLKMRFRSFFIASTIGTAGWTALLAGAGYKLHENFRDDRPR